MVLVWMMAVVTTSAPARANGGELAVIRQVPEPASLLLAGMALIAIGAAMKKTKRKA